MRWVVIGALAAVAIAAPASFADTQQARVTVRIAGANNGQDVKNGGVAGRGTWTAKGGIADSGKVVTYRTQTGSLDTGHATITLRFVCTGTKGTVTFRASIVIRPTTTTSTWKVLSGTKAYKGLYGHGVERENADHTVVMLTGTVERPRKPT